MCMMIRGLVTGGPPHGALAIRWNNCIPGHQDGWIHTPPMAGRSRSSSAGDVAADHIPSLPRAAVALFITSRQPAEMDVMLRACLPAGIDLSLLYFSVRLYRVFCFVLLFVFPWRYAVQATSSDPSSMAVSTHPPTALHRTAPTVPGPAPRRSRRVAVAPRTRLGVRRTRRRRRRSMAPHATPSHSPTSCYQPLVANHAQLCFVIHSHTE
jgi:hypothetical protein